MMDAVSMYPKGFHPIQTGMKPDLSGPAKYVSRRKAAQPVRYYYFNFSNAFEGASGDNTSALVAGKTGLDIDAPELESGAPYNPFKLDVYVLGTYLREAVLEVRIIAHLLLHPRMLISSSATAMLPSWPPSFKQ